MHWGKTNWDSWKRFCVTKQTHKNSPCLTAKFKIANETDRGESKYVDVKLSTSSTLRNWVLPFPPRVQECPESSQSSQKLSPSVFMVVQSRVRAMLPRATSRLDSPDPLPSARTFPTSAEGLSARRNSIAVYLKLGERGRVTFTHRGRYVSGAVGLQNKRLNWC